MIVSNDLRTERSFSASATFKESNAIAEIVRCSPAAIFFSPLVLIVEEDADTRLLLKYLLEIWKYRVVEATGSEQAFQTAIQQIPDLILLNHQTPMSDGFSTIRRMRETPVLESAEIIFISAFGNSVIRASALAAGADDFLVKPTDFGGLETMLQKHLNKVRKPMPMCVQEVL